MKKVFMAFMALATIALVGCDKNEVTPKDVSQYFFPTAEELNIDLDPASPFTEWEIAVSRYDSTKIYPAATVGITVLKNTNDVYTVPATLTFEEGKDEATLTVSFDKLALGESYELTITFAGENFDPSMELGQISEKDSVAGSTYTMSIWPLGSSEKKTGVWVDGFICDWFDADPYPFYVEYQFDYTSGGIKSIHAFDVYSRAGNFADPDAYGIYEAYPSIETSELVGGAYDLIIDVNPDSTAFLRPGELGFDWGYGNMIVRSTETPGTWDGEVLFFSAEDKTTVTCLPEYNTAFYYCGSNVAFFASREAFLASDLFTKNEAPKRLAKSARKIRR